MSKEDLLISVAREFHRFDPLALKKDGQYKVRLVYPRGIEGSSPFVAEKVHSGFLRMGSKFGQRYLCAGQNCGLCALHKKKRDEGDPKAGWFKAKQKYFYQAFINGDFRVAEFDWYLQREIIGVDKDSLSPIAKAILKGTDPFSLLEGRALLIEKYSEPQFGYKIHGLSSVEPLSEEEIFRLKNAPDLRSLYFRPSITESRMIAEWTVNNLKPTDQLDDEDMRYE